MIRIGLCGNIALEEGSIETVLGECVRAHGLEQPLVETFSNPSDLLDACLATTGAAEPFDLVIASLDLPGISGIHLADELSRSGLADDGLRIVLTAHEGLHAVQAARSLVDAYLLTPIPRRRFEEAMGPLLTTISREHAASVVLNCRTGVRRIEYARLTYAETSGRDQLVHRIGENAPLEVHCSSRALFGKLEHDTRFYKVGSSYIVNLDYLSSLALRSSTITLYNGTLIPVPVRLRTSLADAMCAHARVSV